MSYRDQTNLEEEGRELVFQVINRLINNQIVDIIALCEVSEGDISEIKKRCNLFGYEILSACREVGRTQFDFCIIYKRDSIHIANEQYLSTTRNKKTYKIGFRLDFVFKVTGCIFHLFLSHWPSRLQSEASEKREYLADRLREYICDIEDGYQDVGNHPNIILMGDYNDEPFDVSLSKKIMATRDRNIVLTREELFFNPFWGEMSESDNSEHIGTYFHRAGDTTKWRTFDQIMYSHSFVVADSWKIKNIKNRVLADSDILELVTSNKSKLDHLPIMGVIEKGD
nr:endonuclease/exonuclease/phosphatase family protein [Ignatzschineria larvae]